MIPSLSIVIPCFNEAQSLVGCVAAVDAWIASRPAGTIEVVIVDDGSTDGTWAVLTTLLAGRSDWRAVRLAANRGSHIAMRCAYRHATGARVVNLPVDLQDPIENIDLLEREMDERQVDAVLAVRRTRADGWFERITSRLYHGLMHAVHLRNVPVEGTSQFLVSRRIVRQINACDDRGFTFEGFLASAPLSLTTVWYDRTAAAGRSSRWTLAGKIQHALNTVLGFSNVPIRALSLAGATVALVGLAYAVFVVIRFAVLGDGVSGWPSLMTVLLVVGGLNLLALGLIGEYVWRILDESRRRPLYQVEDHYGFDLAAGENITVEHGSRSIE